MIDREIAEVFVNHLRRHLKEDEKIVCKICGKTINEICRDFLRSLGDDA